MRKHWKGAVMVITLTTLTACKTINVEDAVNGAVAGALGAMNAGNPGSGSTSGGGQTSPYQPPAVVPPANPAPPSVSNVDTSKIKTTGTIKPQGADKNPRSATQISISNCYQRESGGLLDCNGVVVLKKLTPEGWVSDTKSFFIRRGEAEVINSGTYLVEYSEKEMSVKNVITLSSGVTNKYALFLD